jgi:proteasome lid subunit RPN8/RPN11
MKNSDASIISFSIAPQELIDAYQTVEKQGMEVVGIFHSHPAQPLPSSVDKKFMQINPVVWIIYSTITNEAKAYIFEEKIEEVQLRVTMA